MTRRRIEDAAASAGVAERTIYRYLNDPAFQAELAKAEGRSIDEATRQLLKLQDEAIAVFLQVLSDKKIAAGVRLRAAQSILDYLLKLRELRNIEQRLAALEASIGHKGH
jgi:hypothetical protein